MAELQTLDLEWKPNKDEFTRYVCVLAAAALNYSEIREAAVNDGQSKTVARAESQLLFCAESAEATLDFVLDFDDMTLAELDLITESIRLCVSVCPGYAEGCRARLAESKKSEGGG